MGLMKNRIAGSLSTLLLMALACSAAEVSGVFGLATAQTPGGAEEPLRVGMPIPEGTVIRTAARAAVDMYLGREAGVIRLTQNTMVTLQQLQSTNSGTETYLHLQHGTILGNGAR